MKKQRLMMVTTSFPYGQGESFVETELPYLADCFDKVTLVPSFYVPDKPPRPTTHKIDLSYARARWGRARFFHVITSFLRALWRYPWLAEAGGILRRAHRLENLKELVRCLYRARLFEQFLEQGFANGERYDMIYFYWIVPEIAGALAFRRLLPTAAGNTIKVVARAHNGDLYEELRQGGYAGLSEAITTGVDAVFCISEHGQAYLANKYPAARARFRLARLGVVDPGFINPQPQDDTFSILSCSFMVAAKRLHLIVDAIDVLLKEHPGMKVRWTHIGDGELYERLRAQVDKVLGGRAEVSFKGYMRQADLVDYYRNAAFDVIINVSDAEGIPVSLMEASSVGIPMVATKVGGSGEIVNDTTGVLIDENASTAAIAQALLGFYDRRNAAAYRVRARAFWECHFNAHSNYLEFGQALRGSLAES